MNVAAWMGLFTEATGYDPMPLDPAELPPYRILLVDGTHWLERHAGLPVYRNAETLVRDLGTLVEEETRSMAATDAHVLFESLLSSSCLHRPPPLPKDLKTKFMTTLNKSLDDETSWRDLVFALHGDRANTDWPKVLSVPDERHVLWRTPLFEWQLYVQFDAHLHQRLGRRPNRFPASLQRLSVSGVRLWPGSGNVWDRHLNKADGEFYTRLRAMNGVYFQKRTKALLGTLAMGYRALSQRSYTWPGPTDTTTKGSPLLDVYAQMIALLDTHADHVARVRVLSARDHALWTLLLAVHRAALRDKSLDMVVHFESGTVVDVGRLYAHLRGYLQAEGGVGMETLLLLVMAQTHPNLGTPVGESNNPRFIWQAFIRLAGFGGARLYRGPSIPYPRGHLAHAFFDYTIVKSELAGWSPTSVRKAIAAHFGLLVAQMTLWTQLEERGLTAVKVGDADILLHSTLVQVAYRQWHHSLPPAPPPSLLSECYARAARAQWLFNYYFSEPEVAARHMFDRSDDGISYWGWEEFAAPVEDLEHTLLTDPLCRDMNPPREREGSPYITMALTDHVVSL